MNWKSISSGAKPPNTGRYIVSIKRENVFSNYSAHYDEFNRKWYKYDPFDDNYAPKEDITKYVIAWMDDMVSFLE